MGPDTGALADRFRRWAEGHPEDTVLSWLFGALVVTTAVVLALDLAGLQAARDDAAIPGTLPPAERVLPSVREGVSQPDRQAADVPDTLTIELVSGGRLVLTGMIDPGASERFAQEIERRGDYVQEVVLDSPGGSVADALAIGRLIRERELATRLEAGAYCASSCPLVFAGGTARFASPDASIGVHQVFTAGEIAATGGVGVGMDRAQRISAECQRYLVEMGVDPRVWMHAMETPKDELFYFTPEELVDLELATGTG